MKGTGIEENDIVKTAEPGKRKRARLERQQKLGLVLRVKVRLSLIVSRIKRE